MPLLSLIILASLGNTAASILVLLVFSAIKAAALAIVQVINKNAKDLGIRFSAVLARFKSLRCVIILRRRLLLRLKSIIYKYSFNLRYLKLYLKL